MPKPPKGTTFEQRFWSKVAVGKNVKECWGWLGAKNGRHYGGFSVSGKPVYAHRVAYMLATGFAPPDDLFVIHSCDNPKCMNPTHLRLGTHQDNMDDMVARGRSRNGWS